MKKKDFNSEVKKMEAADLKEKARATAEELLKLRFRNATGQYEQSHRFGELKKNLARVRNAQSAASKQTTAAAK